VSFRAAISTFYLESTRPPVRAPYDPWLCGLYLGRVRKRAQFQCSFVVLYTLAPSSVLQISTGKFFTTDNLYVTHHRGVLYSNYQLAHEVETAVGSLRPLEGGGDLQGLLFEGDERLEAVAPDGRREFLVSVGGDHLLQDFAAVASFGLAVTCTPDADLARRLTRTERLPLGVPRQPRSYVPRVFDPSVKEAGHDGTELQNFVAALVGLERVAYEAAMRAIRRYVNGLHRIGDDLALGYALLVASVESLAQGFDDFRPSWGDYDQAKREAIDAGMRRTNASEATSEEVRRVLLELEHAAVARRYREFALRNVAPAFFREEAVGVTRPVRQRDLPGALDQAYRVRSAYLHALRELPRILTLAPSEGDTVVAEGRLLFTFQGLARMARHVIRTFVERSPKVEREGFDYRRSLPNIVTMQIADKYWLHRAEGFDHRTAHRYLSAFLRELERAMIAPQEHRPPLTAMPDVLAKIERIVPGLAKPEQRVPMLVLYLLFHRFVDPSAHRPNSDQFFSRFAPLLETPSIESLLAHVILEEEISWTSDEVDAVLGVYFARPRNASGLSIPPILETALTLSAAEVLRRDSGTRRARELISAAVANLPGNEKLLSFEREVALGDLPPINWRSMLLPASRRTDKASNTEGNPG